MINKLVVENLRHRPIRTLLSVIAIAIQVTLVLALVGLSRGMLNDQARRAKGVGADILVRPPSGAVIISGGQMLARIIPAVIEKTPHVQIASGILTYGTDLFNYLTGVDLATFDKMSGGFQFVRGGGFKSPDDVMVDEYYAAQHRVRVGDTVNLINRPWHVSGVFVPGMLARVVVPLDTLQGLTANTGKVTMVYVKVDNSANINATIAALSERLKQYKIYSMEDYVTLFSPGNIPMLTQFIGVVIGLGVLVGFLVVFLSMYTAVLERTREIGVLKALGGSPGLILNILLRETALLAVAGSLLGIALAYGTRALIARLMPGTLIQAIVYDWWFYAAALALLGALLGAIYPGLKAARQDAIEALAYE
ncbi:MAG TPA: ABC transporter permease [Bryobacteraceae bacterium]|nr:ABC transporter permease [Bryobacteraceae bacterium]